MLKRLSLILLLAIGGGPPLAGDANAANCRLLQMQMMQFQASREMRQYERVRELMARSGCGGGGRQGLSLFAPERRAVVTRPRAPAPERQAARREERRREEPATRKSRAPRVPVAAGTFRTLCVRSCDGYYFPISFSTTRDHFETDQAACERICPGADAEIYYHRSLSEGPESMISLAGDAYADLPVAFSYRTGLNPSCSCGRPAAIPLTANAETGGDTEGTIAAPLPVARPAPGEDPETLANRAGRFVPHFQSRPVAAGGEGGAQAIRTVGPGEPEPVAMSPVPNDFDTSLLWEAARSDQPEAGPTHVR